MKEGFKGVEILLNKVMERMKESFNSHSVSRNQIELLPSLPLNSVEMVEIMEENIMALDTYADQLVKICLDYRSNF